MKKNTRAPTRLGSGLGDDFEPAIFYPYICDDFALHMGDPASPVFQEAFLIIPSRRIFREFLNSPIENKRLQYLLSPFKNMETIRADHVITALDALAKKDREMDVDKQLLLWGMIAKSSTFNEVVRDAFKKYLMCYPVLPPHFSHILDRSYPNLNPVPDIKSPFWKITHYIFRDCLFKFSPLFTG